MKQLLQYSLACLTIVAASMAMIACGDDDQTALISAIYPSTVNLVIPADQQQLIYYDDKQEINVLPLLKGESVTFGHVISPENVTFDDVNWTSTDESVATVDQVGKVTAIDGDGLSATIIQVAPAAFFSGSGICERIKIVVSNTLIPAQTITIHAPQDEVFAGESLQLSAAITPATTTYKTVKWSSSNEAVATVNPLTGLVTGKVSNENSAVATITATAVDGSQVYSTKEITVKQIVQPEEITIDQTYSFDNGYLFAIADKRIALNYTTVPVECTTSLIQWTSSDPTIATVADGVVTFNQAGKFGNITITASCPTTGHTSAITLHLAEGLVRELFHDQNNYSWYNATQSGNGTSSSHVWSYGKITITTYKQNDTNQRGDLRSWNTNTWLHAGKYPIFAIRMDDAIDRPGVTGRNITFDAAGNCDGKTFSGGLNGNNNKWLHDYKCSDGSHVFIYDLSTQAWATGGVLPTTSLATFTTFQFKYADIKELSTQITYNVYWVQTFKTINDVKAYIESEGLTYTIIK